MFGEVILVDASDVPLGTMEKLAAHREGRLHRAFSVFLFDDRGRWLLQRRHPDKYHSGGLWTNTCCSHQQPGQTTLEAAAIRLRQEMGIETELTPAFHFTYRAQLDQGLIEHELDHVLMGEYNGAPLPNPAEVCDWRWVDTRTLVHELEQSPDRFTAWFREVAQRVIALREQAAA